MPAYAAFLSEAGLDPASVQGASDWARVPVATKADQPFEMDVPPGRDLMAEARGLGRPLLIVRLGQRDVSPEELARIRGPIGLDIGAKGAPEIAISIMAEMTRVLRLGE